MTELLKDWPLLAVVFGMIAIVLAAIALVVVKVWGEYKVFRAEDLAWRERQNKERETSNDRRDDRWRLAMEERDKRYEALDRERENKIVDLASMIRDIATILQNHDAKTDSALTLMKERTTPLSRRRND